MFEIRIGHNEYEATYVNKMATSYEKSSKLKTYVQVDENKFILSKDVDKVDLVDKNYKLFLNTIDNVLVFRF